MMLKLIGCILIIAVGGVIGFAKALRYKARVEQLSLCRTLFLRLAARARGTGESTRELVSSLAESEVLDSLVFLKSASERLSVETDFPTVWRECVEKSKPSLALKEDDYQPLFGLCEVMGSTDLNGIVANATLAAQQYEQAELSAKKEYDTSGKLFRSLGLLCGVAVAVLFL